MPVPIVFRGQGSGTATYDWFDLTSGVGYKRFYGAGNDLSTSTYFLSTQLIDSATSGTVAWYKQADLSNGAAAKVIDIDFDSTFQRPANIGGVAYFSITTKMGGNANITGTYIIIKIYHVSAAAVETQIGTATSASHTNGANDPFYNRTTLKVTLTSTHFGIGETLRLTVEGWGNDDQGGSYLKIHYDPESTVTYTDVSARTIGTDLIFDVPFKVDI